MYAFAPWQGGSKFPTVQGSGEVIKRDPAVQRIRRQARQHARRTPGKQSVVVPVTKLRHDTTPFVPRPTIARTQQIHTHARTKA